MESENFLQLKRALQKFQAARLNTTYTDLKKDPEYAEMGRFFFEELYAPEDFSYRDASIKKLHKLLKKKIYAGVISAVGKVIELHELSDRLDDRMVDQMIALDVGTEIDMDQYQKVYRSLDNYDERLYQITLGAEVTCIFHRLSRKWAVAISLKTVRKVAHLVGMGAILDFIYDGYSAFRSIKNIDYFVETIDARERAWHDEIWRGQKKAA